MAKTKISRRLKAIPRKPAPTDSSPDQYFSRALEKGLQALQALGEAPGGLTLTQAAGKLGLTKASAFRIVRTLETLGYVTKSPDGRYALAGGRSPQLPLRTIQAMLQNGAEPVQNLALEMRETVSMAALFENHIEVILVVESPQLIRMGNTAGRILPPHASSLGKAITAFQDRENCQRLLRSYGTTSFTPSTITDERTLHKEFERIRSRGHAEDWEESTPGGVCFAAPILRPERAAIGAISLSMPKMRLEGEEQQQRIVEAVLRTARGISEKIYRSATRYHFSQETLEG
jgi:IclR family acetate operon transcriptional repressor